LALDLRNERRPLFLVAPTLGEPQLIDVEIDRSPDVGNEQDWARKPFAHDTIPL
jgi:hypothetical protein